MSHPIPNTFSTYSLTPQEQRAGMMLTPMNIAVIQNLRSSIAEEKLNLVFTPNDVLSYTQHESYLKGQMDILSHLLNCNEEAIAASTTNSQPN